ncbi:glycosyltransferase family 2 protein [Alistipes senegalensis]|uniref:glycosyltransferase family 2 protein n=1 Tax=Alistipes senegalensis TaxID=1288121 RepID=UPI00242FB9F9|nr:glycosyltransferase family 2 protein [Alistipes senegalensis]
MISIVIPTYNAAKFIGFAIESIIRQTYTDWELIVVDDCSTDDTATVVESYRKEDERIKLIRRKTNSGGARKPRYDGILTAKGDFITHIDSDDFIEE